MQIMLLHAGITSTQRVSRYRGAEDSVHCKKVQMGGRFRVIYYPESVSLGLFKRDVAIVDIDIIDDIFTTTPKKMYHQNM